MKKKMKHENDLIGALAVLRDERDRYVEGNLNCQPVDENLWEGSHEEEVVLAIDCVSGFCRRIHDMVAYGYNGFYGNGQFPEGGK